MAFTTPSHAQPSSKPFISGTPASLAHTNNIFQDFASKVGDAIVEAIKVGREDLRQAMSASPAWRPWVDHVSLSWDGSQFSFDLTGTDEEIAIMRSIEYGDGLGSAPQPLLRKQAGKLTLDAGRAIRKSLSEEVAL